MGCIAMHYRFPLSLKQSSFYAFLKKMLFYAAKMFVFIKANLFSMILVAHFEFLVL